LADLAGTTLRLVFGLVHVVTLAADVDRQPHNVLLIGLPPSR